jgi:tRNA modification GTPase
VGIFTKTPISRSSNRIIISELSLHSGPLEDTIIALATPEGTGAIAVLRLSGPESISAVNDLFPSKNLLESQSHTLHFGKIESNSGTLDEVLVSIFRTPKSYTGEDLAEISCHGSSFIAKSILETFIQKGLRQAEPGEFTKRAFLNGKLDLSQAEGVADLIASDSQASHHAAIHQLKGGIKIEIARLRDELLELSALLELELDFGEEDVEFADRSKLKELANTISEKIHSLLSSFSYGNAVKDGISVVIAGPPNVGKSTLLNALLNEERAIVSEIPGTTRDFIEDVIHIGGIKFRFTDTAGIRETTDQVEALGVKKTHEKIRGSMLALYLFDASTDFDVENIAEDIHKLEGTENIFILGNKIDLSEADLPKEIGGYYVLGISASKGLGLEDLKQDINDWIQKEKPAGDQTLITNVRHYQAFKKCEDSLSDLLDGLQSSRSTELLAEDIRLVLIHLGEITGEVTNEEVLGAIFSRFCIGK